MNWWDWWNWFWHHRVTLTAKSLSTRHARLTVPRIKLSLSILARALATGSPEIVRIPQITIIGSPLKYILQTGGIISSLSSLGVSVYTGIGHYAPNGIAAGAGSVGAPAFTTSGQGGVVNLVAANVATVSSTVGTTALNVTGGNVSNFTAANLIAGAEALGLALLHQTNKLTASSLATHAAGIDQGALNAGAIVTSGEQITLANTGRAGAAAQGLPNYSSTLTVQGGTVTFSTSGTHRNINFTGQVYITGGQHLFEYCLFSAQPPQQTGAVRQYNAGNNCGNVIFNYCDWDSGWRGNQGTNEADGFECGSRATSDAPTYNTTSSFKLYRCTIQGYGNLLALHKWQNNSDPSLYTGQAYSEITESYFANAVYGSATHVDNIEWYSADNIYIQRCCFLGDPNNNYTCGPNVDIFTNLAVPTRSSPTFPLVFKSNFVSGAAEPIRISEIAPQVQAIYFMDNRFGDSQMWGYMCDFYNYNVTNNLAYAQANPAVMYWETTNVWSSVPGAVTNPPYGTGGTGEPTAGLPHVVGAYVDSRNFCSIGDVAWGGSMVGPASGALTALSIASKAASLGSVPLNGRYGAIANNLATAAAGIGAPAFGIAGAWPDATTTGVPSGTVLTTYTGPNPIRTSNTTLDSFLITGGLDIVGASNVTIKNCKIDATGDTNSNWTCSVSSTSDNIVFSHCEIIMDPRNVQAAAAIYQEIPCTMLVEYCNIHGCTHGMDTSGGKDATHRLTVDHCYIHDLASANTDPHFDCLYLGTSDYVTVQNCNLDLSNWGQTCAVMTENYWGAFTDVLVQNNLLRGGGYTVCARGDKTSGSVTNVRFLNNAMQMGQYGYYDFTGIQEGTRDSVTFSGNYDWQTKAAITWP